MEEPAGSKSSQLNDSDNNFFKNEIYSKAPEKAIPTNETYVYHNIDFWPLDILDLEDYGPEKNRGYRPVSVVIDRFIKFAWTVAIVNKSAIIITNSFEKILTTSIRKSHSI